MQDWQPDKKGGSLKKGNGKSTDELRSEYRRSDFATLVRGKYATRVAKESNVVVLEPEVALAFPNDKAINDALRGLLESEVEGRSRLVRLKLMRRLKARSSQEASKKGKSLPWTHDEYAREWYNVNGG